MKKKILYPFLVALALFVAIPTTSFASSGDNQTKNSNGNVHVYKKVIYLSNAKELKNVNVDAWIQDILKNYKNYKVVWKYNGKQVQQPVLVPEKKEEKKQPVIEEKPVPRKESVQKQPAPAPQQPPKEPVQQQPQEQSGYQLNQFEQQVVNLTNQERAKAGLAPLKVDLELSRVARIKSQDMRDKRYFSHTSPTYGSPFDMMRSFGIQYRAAGENIAMGQRSPQEVVNAWMNSDGHRRNILNANYTHIGVGYVADGNYWTQLFIGK